MTDSFHDVIVYSSAKERGVINAEVISGPERHEANENVNLIDKEK